MTVTQALNIIESDNGVAEKGGGSLGKMLSVVWGMFSLF